MDSMVTSFAARDDPRPYPHADRADGGGFRSHHVLDELSDVPSAPDREWLRSVCPESHRAPHASDAEIPGCREHTHATVLRDRSCGCELRVAHARSRDSNSAVAQVGRTRTQYERHDDIPYRRRSAPVTVG